MAPLSYTLLIVSYSIDSELESTKPHQPALISPNYDCYIDGRGAAVVLLYRANTRLTRAAW